MRQTIYLLHIGKTGGSALKYTLNDIAGSHGIVLCRHKTVLADVPHGQRVAFSTRDPIGRFVSGFNSRLRKGMPHAMNEWSAAERVAFERFRTPNELAEALSSTDISLRDAAEMAMRSIRHVAEPLKKWLVSPEYVRSRSDDIAFVFDQAHLAADFIVFKRLLGVPDDLCLPTDPAAGHKTPPGFSQELTASARQNLERWYAGDFPIYTACLQMRDDRLRGLSAA